MGGSAPEPDPNIGRAALASAQTGEDMLSWMQDQAQITNAWAAEDRARYQNVFQPLQDQMIDEAQTWDSGARQSQRANEARADVGVAAAQAQAQRERQAMARGVDPRSGAFQSATAKAGMDTALAKAGAGNIARRQVEQEGYARRANAVNIGQGLGVNPATSMGLSNGAIATGGNAAMAGYGQQGNLLNTQYQQQIKAWQENQGVIGSIGGALGKIAGAFMSSKKVKHDKRPVRGVLEAVENMPVEEWTYNQGAGDEGTHIGPYAEDFARETGMGDGKSIGVIDAIGVTMGAVKELSSKVDRLSEKMRQGLGVMEAA